MEEISFEDPRTILKRHGLRAKKSWGQNFLVNRGAVEQIARLCVDEPGRRVMEIGAGLGTLTSPLVQLGASVTAVERDPDMCAILREELGDAEGFELEEADAATFDYAGWLGDEPGVVAGNLPYHLTGRILRRTLAEPGRLRKAVFMVQLEVARRLAAGPGEPDRSALSVMTQARCSVRIAIRLSRRSFFPPPRVRSAVVELIPHEPPQYGALAPGRFDQAVKAAFAARRKTLKNSLRTAWGKGADELDQVIAAAGLEPSIRAEKLENRQLLALALAADRAGLVHDETDETEEEGRPG